MNFHKLLNFAFLSGSGGVFITFYVNIFKLVLFLLLVIKYAKINIYETKNNNFVIILNGILIKCSVIYIWL